MSVTRRGLLSSFALAGAGLYVPKTAYFFAPEGGWGATSATIFPSHIFKEGEIWMAQRTGEVVRVAGFRGNVPIIERAWGGTALSALEPGERLMILSPTTPEAL